MYEGGPPQQSENPASQDIQERSFLSSLKKVNTLLIALIKQNPEKAAIYTIAVVALSSTTAVSEGQGKVHQLNLFETAFSNGCRVYRSYPSYYSYGRGYKVHHVPNAGCYVRPPIGYSPYDIYNQRYQMRKCLVNIQQELNAKERRSLIANGLRSEDIRCFTPSIRNVWFMDQYPWGHRCNSNSSGHHYVMRPPTRILGRLTYRQKQAKLNKCLQTLRMARNGHYNRPEDSLNYPMRQCVTQVEDILHDQSRKKLIGEGAKPTSVYCPRIYQYVSYYAAFSAPVPVRGSCYVERQNKPKYSYRYLSRYRRLFSDKQKQSRLKKCQHQLTSLDPLRGRMQKCVQFIKPLKEKKLRQDLIAKGVKPANITCDGTLRCSTDTNGNQFSCAKEYPSYRNWRMNTNMGCYDKNNLPLLGSLSIRLDEISEAEKQKRVEACETELASLQGGKNLQEKMAKCLVDLSEIFNRRSKAVLKEGGTEDSDIICRSDVPTQSNKIWFWDYTKFKAYSNCAKKSEQQQTPPYPYEHDVNEPIPNDTQKQALLKDCQTKLAEAEKTWGKPPDQLAESMQECKKRIRDIQNRQHRRELIAQGSTPANIVCHGYPHGEEPIWDVNTWSDCYDKTTSEQTPLPYDWEYHNNRGEIAEDVKQAWLNKCDITLAELRRQERNRRISGGNSNAGRGLR